MLKMRSRLSRIPANVYLFKVNNRNTRKIWNMFKVNNKKTRTMSMASFWYFYCYFWTFFLLFLLCFDFEQMLTGMEKNLPRNYHYRYCKCYWFNREIVPISGWLRGITKAVASNVPDARQNIATGKEAKAY